MGEENTFAGVGTTCFFCKREDIGTEREKWHEAKLDSFKVRDAIEVPELDTEIIAEKREGFPISYTFSFEPSEEQEKDLARLCRKVNKHHSGHRHYARKTMSKSAKKALRWCHLHMKKCMFGRNRQ